MVSVNVQKEKTRILLMGDGLAPQYVRAFYESLREKPAIECELFDYGCIRKKNIISRVELHYKLGIMIYLLNIKLKRYCEEKKFDLVFIYNSSIIFGDTVRQIKEHGSRVFIYNNDDPFSIGYKPYTWRHFLKQIAYSDVAYSYRELNVNDYKNQGARCVSILLPYYIQKRNYYIPDEEISLSVPDVVFIGHIEDDERIDYIKALIDERIPIGLNSDWEKYRRYGENVQIIPKEIATERYNEIINKAKIAVVFLSHLNHDTYTRRCLEIPATKTMMIAPYTEDLGLMYTEGKEAVFYRSVSDFLSKIKYYLSHPEERKSIGEAGYHRLMQGHNEIEDRIEQILKDYRLINENTYRG